LAGYLLEKSGEISLFGNRDQIERNHLHHRAQHLSGHSGHSGSPCALVRRLETKSRSW
jgi:hypothetical protein